MGEIMLSYEICEPPTDCNLLWHYFISLVSRDYGELVAKAISNQQQNTAANRAENDEVGGDLDPSLSDANYIDNHDTIIPSTNTSSANLAAENNLKKRRGKPSLFSTSCNQLSSGSTSVNDGIVIFSKDDTVNHANSKSSIVEEENAQFLQQLRELQQIQTNKRAKRQVKVLPNPKRVRVLK